MPLQKLRPARTDSQRSRNRSKTAMPSLAKYLPTVTAFVTQEPLLMLVMGLEPESQASHRSLTHGVTASVVAMVQTVEIALSPK